MELLREKIAATTEGSVDQPFDPVYQLVYGGPRHVQLDDCIRVEFMPVGIGGKFVEPPADVLQRCEQLDACVHVLSPTTCANNCSVQVVMEVEFERPTTKALSQRKQRY